MPESYEKLEDFLANQDPHSHLRPDQARELFRAADDVESGDVVLRMQKIVLSCGVCSVILAESDPTYYASAHVVGRNAVVN